MRAFAGSSVLTEVEDEDVNVSHEFDDRSECRPPSK